MNGDEIKKEEAGAAQAAEKRPLAAQILTILVLAFLLALAALSLGRLVTPARQFLLGESDFEQFTQEVKNAYTSNAAKNSLINLNGLFCRALGQRMDNNVIRLENGMLTYLEYAQDVTPVTENLIAFNTYLAQRDIPFLYVQAPYKLDLEGELLPAGMSHWANRNGDEFLSILDGAGVATYDLRPAFSATPELVEENFFRTDHHWTCDAALRAVRPILEQVDALLPGELDLAWADPAQWEAHTYPDLFLGSQGKRVGIYYGGVDDMTYYTPRFETQMSCMVEVNHQRLTAGTYEDAILQMEHLEKDYFLLSPYCVNIGGDYPLVRHRNAGAPNGEKILLLKDSFSLPLQAYLSTLFQEVDVVDPRYFKACTVAQYVNLSQPDVVVMMINPDQYISRGYDSYGAAEQAQWEATCGPAETLVEAPEITVAAGESNYAYGVIGELEYGKRYTLHFDSAQWRTEGGRAVTGLIYNADTEAAVQYGLFDLEYNGAEGCTWSFFTPQEGEGQLQLLLYAGLQGETAGAEISFQNVRLEAQG